MALATVGHDVAHTERHDCWALSGDPCCKEIASCNADVTCKKSFDCLVLCSPDDAACEKKCVSGADAKLADAIACKARSCTEPCGVLCGGIAGIAFSRIVGPDPKCGTCLTTSACAELTTCAQDSKCLQFASCRSRCALLDHSCMSRCQFPLGPQPGAVALDIATDRCDVECGSGRNWTCVGKTNYATGKEAGDVAYNGHIKSALSAKPIKGVAVRISSDLPCTTPIGKGCTTDADGWCSGFVPLTGEPTIFRGWLEASGAGQVPTLGFTWPPVAGPVVGDATYAYLYLDMFTPAELDAAFAIAAVTPDSLRGHVAVRVVDCAQRNAPDLAIEASTADGKSKTIYLSGPFFSPDATKTDKSGTASVANLPEGQTTVRARLVSTKQIVAQAVVFVRSGALTTLLMGPI